MKISEIVNETDLKNIKKRGVYKISYNDSKRIYIGSTTQSFYIRWIQHMWEFKNNCHKNPKLVNVANKHGIKSLSFEIVEVVKDEDKVLEREQYYIDLYDSYKNGLNCSPSAYNSQGCKRNENTLIKNFYNVVSQYSKEGNYIKTYKSLKEAAEKTKTDYVTLSNACNEKTRLANGYQWKKGNNENDIAPVKSKGETTIYQYNNDGIFIKEWNSLKDAADFYDRLSTLFSRAVNKKRKLEGYYWSKEKVDKFKPYINKTRIFKIYQYDKEGVFVKEWNSLKEATNHFIRPGNSFSTAISKGRQFEGYYWSKEKKEVIKFKNIKNGKKEIENVCV